VFQESLDSCLLHFGRLVKTRALPFFLTQAYSVAASACGAVATVLSISVAPLVSVASARRVIDCDIGCSPSVEATRCAGEAG
jgi:hypothetical protein